MTDNKEYKQCLNCEDKDIIIAGLERQVNALKQLLIEKSGIVINMEDISEEEENYDIQ